jgi:hypothetical protein
MFRRDMSAEVHQFLIKALTLYRAYVNDGVNKEECHLLGCYVLWLL